MERTYAHLRSGAIGRVSLLAIVAGALALLIGLTAPLAVEAKPKKKGKAATVNVMTRNLFLGADLGPAIGASSAAEFVAANGQIVRDVDATDFPRRARALAAEIRKRKPDFVGLQEVALWRTAPPSLDPLTMGPSATDVRYDFLELLLAEVNKGKKKKKKKKKVARYRPAVAQRQFDFEAPADVDGDPATGILGGEINARLTMRDAILVRKDRRLEARNATGGNFENLLVLEDVGGVPGLDVSVTRGWTALDAIVVRGKKKRKVRQRFRFVNTHLEAFDDRTQVPSIRAQQAAELIAPGGPAARRKVILLGDLNSDSPGFRPGDEQAFETLLAGGFVRRSTTTPPSCCVSDLFSSPPSEFDHVVDHVLTNKPKKVKLRNSAVTGRSQVNGIYPSDHAGVFSRLLLKR